MYGSNKIRLVVATRVSREDFYKSTATGKSLKLYEGLGFELDLYDSNSYGLPVVYNQSIDKSRDDPAILVFVHDDVHFLEFWWMKKIRDALNNYDIIGVVGNTRRSLYQPTWCHKDLDFNYDNGYMSGAIANGKGFPPNMLCVYGPSPMQVKLIDGVFMACHSEVLIRNDVKFDTDFEFHYYDLDFCRQAEQKELTMGTIEISLVHESGGTDSIDWKNSMKRYFDKWSD